jgi:cbb3-type cytochrome oxidase subunit 3
MDGLLLVLFFIAGSWILLQLSRKSSNADAIAHELALSAP